MAKCSQCLHLDACSMLFEMAIGRKPTANGNKAEEKCPHFKDKTINTNADRIRAMSDEELAFLLIQYRDDWGDYCTHKGCYATQKEAVEAETEWLKQPAQ